MMYWYGREAISLSLGCFLLLVWLDGMYFFFFFWTFDETGLSSLHIWFFSIPVITHCVVFFC